MFGIHKKSIAIMRVRAEFCGDVIGHAAQSNGTNVVGKEHRCELDAGIGKELLDIADCVGN